MDPVPSTREAASRADQHFAVVAHDPCIYIREFINALCRCFCCDPNPSPVRTRDVKVEEEVAGGRGQYADELKSRSAPRRRPTRPPVSSGSGGQTN
ncbi:hypothetical protein MLD38_028452 [Melastoma candidum]|uniref:Uncharacterized protein n=1 Tax=Melastoma candidum TaxID=119954 RepID=A0ACB9N124_9MYRT|nr:hypothetical protein MLD38_028452 [Melastoma candidum]